MDKTISRKNTNRNKLLILILMMASVAAIFLLIGLTERNMGFFLPRRLRKLLAILVTSYCIGYSSVTFQTITNNNILTPSVMGLDSLYLFIQTVIVFFFGSRQLAQMTGMANYFLSIGFMIISSCILFFMLFRKDGKSVYFLVLTGIVIGTFFNGLATMMQVLMDPNEFLILQGKMFASFNKINEDLLGVSLILIGIMAIVSLGDLSKLDALSLGADISINLGISYHQLVLKSLIIIAVLVSVSTALTGPITFLGILVASLSRELFRTYRHTWRIAGAVVMSAFLMILGQLFVERIFKFNTTISVIINFVGGIYFVYLMLKEVKK